MKRRKKIEFSEPFSTRRNLERCFEKLFRQNNEERKRIYEKFNDIEKIKNESVKKKIKQKMLDLDNKKIFLQYVYEYDMTHLEDYITKFNKEFKWKYETNQGRDIILPKNSYTIHKFYKQPPSI